MVSDDASGFADIAFQNVMEKRLTPEATREITKIIPSDSRYLFGLNSTDKIDTALIERTTVNSLTKEAASKAGLYITRGLAYIGTPLDIALFVAPWIIDICSHDAPWGNYATNQVFDSLKAVGNSDAMVWNNTHDAAHQITTANTKLTPPDPTDPIKQGNSPLMHVGTLSYNTDVEKGVDSQIALNISLEALTTPNKRLDYVNPQKAKDDPWLGNIDFDASPRPQATWDAVLHMEISNNTMTPDKEIQYQGQLLQMDQLGLTSMASDDRLAAPSSKIISMVNRNRGNNLLANNNLHSKLLKASNSGLLKVGKLEGVFLNSGQDLNMKVTLPTKLSSNGDSDILYGGGLGVTYIGEDESGLDNNFIPIKSDSLRAIFDGEYLYSKFSGAYPLALGQSSMLKLSIGGYNDSKRHEGHLYVADAGSKIKSLPVYINAHLIREPSATTVDPTGAQYPSTFVIQVQNMGSEDYAKVVVNGLPSGTTPINNASGSKMCSEGLKSGDYCEFTFDASSLEAGNYSLMINGLTANQLRVATPGADDPDGSDSQAFQLEVTGGF